MKRKAQKKHPRVPRKFVPPEPVRAAARRGLALLQRKKAATPVGVARGKQLAGGRAVSIRTVARMAAYFARHRSDRLQDDGRSGRRLSAGYVSWQLWGGNAGRDWANAIVSRLSRLAPDLLRAARRRPEKKKRGNPGIRGENFDLDQARSRADDQDGDCLLIFPTARDKACIGHRLIPLLSGSKNVFVVRLREGETVDEVVAWTVGPRAMGKLPAPNGPRWSGYDWSWSAWCAFQSDDGPCPMQPLWFDESSLMEGVTVYGTIVVRPDREGGFAPGCLARLAKKYFRTMPVNRRG